MILTSKLDFFLVFPDRFYGRPDLEELLQAVLYGGMVVAVCHLFAAVADHRAQDRFRKDLPHNGIIRVPEGVNHE